MEMDFTELDIWADNLRETYGIAEPFGLVTFEERAEADNAAG